MVVIGKKYLYVLFIIVSCIELSLGVINECTLTGLPWTRFLLWGFMLVYLGVLLSNYRLYTYREKVLFIILLVIGTVLYVESGINTCIKAAIYIFALKGVDVRKLFRWLAITLLVTVVGIVGANLIFGVGLRYLMDIRAYRGFSGKRYTFGFCNPNLLQFEAFAVLAFGILTFENRLNYIVRIFIGVVYCLVCFLTDSKSGLIIGLFVYSISFAMVHVKWSKWKEFLFVGICISLVAFISISIVAASDIGGVVIDIVDKLISERMGQLLICNNDDIYFTGELMNWRLFSTRLHKNMYDMGYVQLFYYYGIVPAICYLSFVVYSAYTALKRDNITALIVLWGFCIYLFMEARYFSNYLTHDYLLMTSSYIVMCLSVRGTDDEKEFKI